MAPARQKSVFASRTSEYSRRLSHNNLYWKLYRIELREFETFNLAMQNLIA